MGPVVSIIVVTWNAMDIVDRCLTAVQQATRFPGGVPSEIFVIDNASSDGTAQHVRSTWPDVQVIEAGSNAGMAAGNNIGMRAAAGEAFLLLNSDAFPAAGSIDELYGELARSPDIAVVVPRLHNEDGSLQRSIRGFPSTWRYATEFWYLRRCFPGSRWFDSFYGAGDTHAVARDIEWAMGACMLVRRAAIEDIGLMDEAFYMYGEEVDWMRRLHVAGWRARFQPAAVVTHLGGASTSCIAGAMYQRQLTNHVRYMAVRHGVRAARSTARVILWGLRLRAALYALLACSSATDTQRSERASRAAAFRAGAHTVAALDIDGLTARRVPPFEPR